MPYKIEASCPNCKKKAQGISEIGELFGWRIIKGKKIPQSHCIDCRGNHFKKKKSKK